MTVFFDTNILAYALEIGAKAEVARERLAEGGFISVQVLNELVNVLQKKYRRDWVEITAILTTIHETFEAPRPITLQTHLAAMALSRDHKISIYDALIIASALEAQCTQLCTEDLQHGRKFGELTIVNPFKPN